MSEERGAWLVIKRIGLIGGTFLTVTAVSALIWSWIDNEPGPDPAQQEAARWDNADAVAKRIDVTERRIDSAAGRVADFEAANHTAAGVHQANLQEARQRYDAALAAAAAQDFVAANLELNATNAALQQIPFFHNGEPATQSPWPAPWIVMGALGAMAWTRRR